jgi:hypothetical protein
MNYEYELRWGNSKSLGKTETISNDGMYANSMFLVLSISEAYFDLKFNGEHTKTVKFISHIYNLNELNPALFSRIPSSFTSKKLIYTPELDDLNVQKQIIKKVTKPSFYQSGLVQNTNDKNLSNKWINISSKLIKSSNISEMNYLTEIDKEIIKTSKEKKIVDNENKRLKITVDNLRVRTSPYLDAEKIENLPLNSKVEFLNEKSDKKITVTIKGKEINEYWYQIKTPSGNIGWIHGCCFETE